MKTVHIITRLILGGAQENTLLTVEGLHHRHRDDVILITGPAEGPEGDLFTRAESQGFVVERMPELVRAIKPGTDWAAYRALQKSIRRHKPDVVHTHSSKAGIVGRAAAWREKVPAVVHTIHGMPFGRFEKWHKNALYIGVERWAAKRCHAIVSVADAMSEQAIDAGVGRPEQFLTVYSGMDVDAFLNPPRSREEVRAELGLKPEDVAFATVARLFELKGHDDILAVAPEILKTNSNVRFVFIGDGILRDRFKADAKRAGIEHAIIFTGLVPPGRIPELIGAVDAVVHPSLREGLARVLPQSLIVGRPVISYDIDGAKEVVIPTTGHLLSPQDLEGLKAAIIDLAGDPEKRALMGSEGRRRFAHQFRKETMTDELRALYERLLAGQPVRPDQLGWRRADWPEETRIAPEYQG
jgi:glycosyltransferase involved in cell wall biosynthesis